MALNVNPPQMPANPQLLQQRLNVREQEINALKVQNRHLLEQIDGLEKEAEPNQIDTQFVADEVKRSIDPVIQQMKITMTSSFEILQSTMRGIYQQSQRAEKAVVDMAAQTRELEVRLNDQRKQDQNFYQDKIFSMISNFCDRLERQVEVRLKALGSIEIMTAKQNEILTDLETVKGTLESVQRNAENGRADLSRAERNSAEIRQKIVDVQNQTRSFEDIVRLAVREIENHRIELNQIRNGLLQAVEAIQNGQSEGRPNQAPNGNANTNVNTNTDDPVVSPLNAVFTHGFENENPIPSNLLERVEQNLTASNLVEAQNQDRSDDGISNAGNTDSNTADALNANADNGETGQDAAMVLSLLKAEKNDLLKAAQNARNYLKNHLDRNDAPVNAPHSNPEVTDALESNGESGLN